MNRQNIPKERFASRPPGDQPFGIEMDNLGSAHSASSQLLNNANDEDGLSYPSHNHILGQQMGGSAYTTMRRRKATIRLAPTGNFSLKQRVPDEVLEHSIFRGAEFETIRYTAVTCGPESFIERRYDLRVFRMKRLIEIFVVVTMYNENQHLFLRTMFALAMNIRYLALKNRNGWGENAWQRVLVCIVADGRAKIDPMVLNALEAMGVYLDGIAQSAVNDSETQMHIYESTAQVALDERAQFWSAKDGIQPMQVIFCLKEKNAKKIDSHRWFFRSFCPLINPRVCMLVDVGTKPQEASLYHLWKVFHRNPQVGGACGEICADMGEGTTYLKNVLNPLVASQNFEYKISNLVDKSMESVFGYITVLPGAFSAYRYEALKDTGPQQGPLAKYFEGEMLGKNSAASVFTANLYLAEDRILCFEIVAKPKDNWTLHYTPKARAHTDVPETVPEFLSQRRRWLNGSLFAGFYSITNVSRMFTSGHSVLRKMAFALQLIHNVLSQIFSWFILGSFAITFYYLLQEFESNFSNPLVGTSEGTSKGVEIGLAIARYFYPVVLVCLFIISFGNRPQSFRVLYTILMIGFGIIGAGMMAIVIKRCIQLSELFFGTSQASVSSTLNTLSLAANFKTDDSLQLLLNSVAIQSQQVMKSHTKQLTENSMREAYLFMIAFASTIGLYVASSLIQLDFMHILFCLVQYLLLLPSYINVLTVYSLSNLHDVTWGTKGDGKAEDLPAISVVKKEGEEGVVANVRLALNRADISLHYREAVSNLTQSTLHTNPVEKYHPTQEDDYKGFRTLLILCYVASNGILFVAATTGGNYIYLQVLVYGVAALSAIKLLGVLMFMILRLAVYVFGTRKPPQKSYKQNVMLNDSEMPSPRINRLLSHMNEDVDASAIPSDDDVSFRNVCGFVKREASSIGSGSADNSNRSGRMMRTVLQQAHANSPNNSGRYQQPLPQKYR